MASLTFQNFIFFSGVWTPQSRISSNVIFIKCLKRHLSGSQASKGSPQGPIEIEMCHLKAEKNKPFWVFTEPDTISLFCLLMYMYFLFILLPHFVQ